jgi:putative peptidoglycan lipid II flippase
MTDGDAATDQVDPQVSSLPSGGKAASLVAAGILLSRLFGLVRQRIFAQYLGTSDITDAFNAAFRIPNILQNLFGEGVLSASFIPVYARLRSRGDDAGRREVAGAVLALLLLATSLLVLIGIALAPVLVTIIVPSWSGPKRELTVRLMRVLFPGAALFVLGAWTLGVLNSHGRFFLSYVSGVFWNLAMIVTLLVFGGHTNDTRLVWLLAWGSVAGALLQFAVQVPSARALLGAFRLHWGRRSSHVKTVVRNFVPVFLGRGVTSISGYSDAFLAGFLGEGAITALTYAQVIYMLPISLFGMAVSAAELPAMSSVAGLQGDVARVLRARVETALARIAFFVVPSATGFLTLGDEVAGFIYRGGRFGAAEARWVWAVLAGAAVGLVASGLGRLYSSAFYALHDARTPLRFAAARVTISIALGATLALLGPRALGIDVQWGVAGITLASGLAGWVEFTLLRRALTRRIGVAALSWRGLGMLWAGAATAAAVSFAARWLPLPVPAIVRSALLIALFTVVYLMVTWWLGVPEARQLGQRVRRIAGARTR